MQRKRPEKGQSLLEFAMILPILLIILAGVLDLGRLYFAYVAVTDAASEGVAYAASHPDDDDEILARARDAGNITSDTSRVEYFCATCCDPYPCCETCPGVATGDTVSVTVTYSFTVATPIVNALVPGGVIPLHAVATEAVLGGALQ